MKDTFQAGAGCRAWKWEEGVTSHWPSRDLLGKDPQEKLEIRLCPDGSGQLYVPGLTEFQVQSVDDINKVKEGLGASGGW
jgi:hypothetical protein